MHSQQPARQPVTCEEHGGLPGALATGGDDARIIMLMHLRDVHADENAAGELKALRRRGRSVTSQARGVLSPLP
jgi:hypothetical protein